MKELEERAEQKPKMDEELVESKAVSLPLLGAYLRTPGKEALDKRLSLNQGLNLFFVSSLVYHLAFLLLVSSPSFFQGHPQAPSASDMGRIALMLFFLPFFSPHPYVGIALGSFVAARRWIKSRLSVTFLTALLTVVGLTIHWLTALSPNFQRGVNLLELLQLLGAFCLPALAMSLVFHRLSGPSTEPKRGQDSGTAIHDE